MIPFWTTSYSNLQLVKAHEFRKLKRKGYLFLFFQSKSPCCLLVTSPSVVRWNITWNIITSHITTRSEMWLLSSETRIFQSQIWSLLLSAKTCIATSTKEKRVLTCIQVLKRPRRWGTVATISNFGRGSISSIDQQLLIITVEFS